MLAEPGVVVRSRADQLLHRLVTPGALLGGRYRPDRILGQGGMGLVVHGVDTRLDREIAIKWLLPDLARDHALVSRFASEATALARIHHPNVVQILDVADADADATYYVMEFVPGVPLARWIREGPLPWSEAYDVLLQTANALAAVHSAGLVHRDVKPSNILCHEVAPDTWHVKVIDFGIARTVGTPRLTLPGEMLGTAPYMAPEQFAGLEGDRRTDVYGWGVLALELLGRVSPVSLFGSENLAGAPLRDAAAGVLDRARVQPRIAAIVRRCLECSPDDRWPDMDAVTSQLRALDDGGSPTLIYRRAQPIPRGETLLPGVGESTGLGIGLPRPTDDIALTDEQPCYEEPSTRNDARVSSPPVRPRRVAAVIGVAALPLVAALVFAAVHLLGSPPPLLDGGALDDWPAIAPAAVVESPVVPAAIVPLAVPDEPNVAAPPAPAVVPTAALEVPAADAATPPRRKQAGSPATTSETPTPADVAPAQAEPTPPPVPDVGPPSAPEPPIRKIRERPRGLKDPFG